MTIIDLYGSEVEITDLNLARMQADDFRHYRHATPESAKLDAELQAYWEDFYQKLLLLC